ncbi:MAG: glycosyltransferase [Peptoniphilaceae bacterium]|uniref:glycosyltransferase n=1 Tax=Parvimonas sp. TaxID=1944660 RepID=UPI0025DC6D0C|nr:glycosyltransferase [Parvimonas sp.]MCI5997236.1 glycosyltransferase [Parvimonas sp.]MDD7764368.1 glycosyltransferase [Peptoniphilaceae bacterium]MDY3050046.1 glycosyltransferase [Parvimonas sp.]
MKKKRILFFLWSFSLGGGAEKILSTIVNNLDLEKYEVDIFEVEHFDKGFEKVDDRINILKSWQCYRQSRLLRAFLWRIRKYFPNFVRRILIEDKYDIEVSFTIINPPFPFSKRENVKKISWIHGSIESFNADINKMESHRKYLKNVSDIISVSEKTKESIIEVYPEYKDKVSVIYNGYDFDSIVEKSNEKTDIEIEKKSVCIVGRIENLKGSLEVYEIAKKLIKELKKDYHFYFMGSGELENELKEKVSNDNLETFIHFLGYQKNPYKYIKNMKLMLSMSKQEGFSGAIVEGMSLGVPFVSTDVGGVKELSCKEKYGKIVYNEDDAVNKIIDYLDGKVHIDIVDMKNYISKFTVAEQMKNINDLIK